MSITIEANASGRSWSEDPAAWAHLSTPEGCPMCEGTPHPEWNLIETEFTRVSAWREAVLPTYACVVSQRHVIEPFDLPDRERHGFFDDCMATARGLAQLFHPAKMNYEIHGNTMPHLHMHLFPRLPDDVYVGYPNHCRSRFTRTDEELARMRDAVQSAFRDLRSVPWR
jgi:diadenosine tetraphosphate (Ap4A) HIT family hydrolase